ncbi:patatin-like phospholipase family protein, partial [Caldimonas tepidiphila]|uniref:patatin-like phospholipase family protein n=1 Tax=Caldimonas tepidiphila TaxID=2315841 RepID=UPI000E5BD586
NSVRGQGNLALNLFAQQSLYSHAPLEKVLAEYFADAPLDDAVTKTFVTCYDIQSREPVFLKSWKEEHRAVPMAYAARATSAAPTFFEPALVRVGDSMRALIDGGVFVNSPAVSAYAEARKIFPDETEFFVLSLGTGELTRPIAYDKAKDWGKAEWLPEVLSCMFDGMEDAACYQMRMFLGESFIRLQTDLSIASDDMDAASEENIGRLRAEAKKLLDTHRRELDEACRLLAM